MLTKPRDERTDHDAKKFALELHTMHPDWSERRIGINTVKHLDRTTIKSLAIQCIKQFVWAQRRKKALKAEREAIENDIGKLRAEQAQAQADLEEYTDFEDYKDYKRDKYIQEVQSRSKAREAALKGLETKKRKAEQKCTEVAIIHDYDGKRDFPYPGDLCPNSVKTAAQNLIYNKPEIIYGPGQKWKKYWDKEPWMKYEVTQKIAPGKMLDDFLPRAKVIAAGNPERPFKWGGHSYPDALHALRHDWEQISYHIDSLVEEIEKETELRITKKLLGTVFALGNRVRVTWGQATIEQHQTRIDLLSKNAKGNIEAASRHKAAIELIKQSGSTCLQEVKNAKG